MTQEYFSQLEECTAAKKRELMLKLEVLGGETHKIEDIKSYVRSCVNLALKKADSLPKETEITDEMVQHLIEDIRVPNTRYFSGKEAVFHEVGKTIIIAVKAILIMEKKRKRHTLN